MKLVIDSREAFSERKTGKGQWLSGFLSELRTRNVEVTLLSDTEAEGVVALKSGILWHKAAADYVCDNSFDAYISPTSFITPTIIGSKVPVFPVIHDMIAFQGGKHDMKATLIERLLLPRVLKHAEHIFTVSESTKADLLTKFPHVSSATVTSIFAGPMEQDPPLSEPDGKTILCVGTLCPRKNQKRLIAAYASLPDELRTQFRLVLVGGRGWCDDCIVHCAMNTKGVEWRNYIADEEYKELLSTATVFAYPSLYEGFGMQVLDALQRAIPVLTSNCGSLAEVVGDAALIVDPESERSIASGLIALLEHEDVRSTLREKGPLQANKFSWKRTVDVFLGILETCLTTNASA